MSYQVLARKWRPQSFESLIGQEPIVTALRNALSERRIAQAYLFSGIRGVGKTTAARLLAKALNCEQGPAPTPCNQCAPCLEITRGSDLDVIEVDAATYSKVEQVRELTESLRYGPARDRYKVVVLDEIHRLSRQAFDALLKIVEEPPEHLVFIFATTEIEAVPVTVLSRCQEFHFRRVPADVVTAHLRHLCEEEHIEASDTALRLVARAGEGSVRDAVALLDQLATFGGGEISDGEAVRLLGGLDIELFHQLLAALAAGDGGGVRLVVRRIEDESWDPRNVYSQFLAFCRDALHLSLADGAGGGERVDLPEEAAAALADLARDLGYENLLRLLHVLLSSESLVRRSEAGALAVEIAWLKAAELPKLTRVEEILAGGVPAQAAGPGRPGPAPAREPARTHDVPPPRQSPTAPTPVPRPAPPEPPPRTTASPQTTAPPAATAGSSGGGDVLTFLAELARQKQSFAAMVEAARPRLEGRRLLLFPEPGDASLERRLQRQSNKDLLQQTLARVLGEGFTWKIEPRDPVPMAPESRPKERVELREVEQDETVQKVLDLFNGRVEAVEPHPTRED
jgi:DNA polymerase III subunit gamma/tau